MKIKKYEKILSTILIIASSLSISAQSRTEIGVHGDIVNLGVINKSGYVGNGNYKVENMAKGFGAYLNRYFNPAIGISLGLQFVFSENGTLNYPINGSASQQLSYAYDYASIRIPVGFTGDIFKLFYYHAGANIHIDQSKINNKKNDNPMNGVGIHGELGIRVVLLDLLAIRLGLTAQADNMLAFNQSSNYVFDAGARLRLGLRL